MHSTHYVWDDEVKAIGINKQVDWWGHEGTRGGTWYLLTEIISPFSPDFLPTIVANCVFIIIYYPMGHFHFCGIYYTEQLPMSSTPRLTVCSFLLVLTFLTPNSKRSKYIYFSLKKRNNNALITTFTQKTLIYPYLLANLL